MQLEVRKLLHDIDEACNRLVEFTAERTDELLEFLGRRVLGSNE